MWTDVKNFIKHCLACQSLKADNQKPAGKIQQSTVKGPNEMLGIDLMGPLPRCQERNEYLLVVVDYILSDRGPQFVSAVFRELCDQWTVTPKLTTAYHPQTNMTERVNHTLKCMIASYVDDNHGKWDQYLPEFRFAIHCAVQETTGVTPAELQIDRKLNSPMDKVLKGKFYPP